MTRMDGRLLVDFAKTLISLGKANFGFRPVDLSGFGEIHKQSPIQAGNF